MLPDQVSNPGLTSQVPYRLRYAARRVKIACSLLYRYGEEGDEMLQRSVAIDETWIRSSEWHTKDSPRPLKFRRSQNCPKMLMIFAYDFRGVLTAHRVPTGRTVNKEYYEKLSTDSTAASAQNL